MKQGLANRVVCLTGGKTRKIGGYVIILDHDGPVKKAEVALVKVTGESNITIKETWPKWTPSNPDKTKVYDVDFVYGPLEVTSEVYGTLTRSSISLNCNKCNKGKCKCKGTCKCKRKCECKGTTLTWREDVISHLKKNHPTNTLPASISEAEEEESSDDDPSPPAKRRKRETLAKRLQRREAATDRRVKELEEELNKLGFRVDRAAVKTVVLAEKIVQCKMRASDDDDNDFHLCRGSKDCYVDNVNFTTGWFDEFKRLDPNKSREARGQVDHYGWLLQENFGHRFKSRIVFFTERSDADEMSTFKSIVEDYTDIPFSYGLDEVVLVHMSEVKVDEKDARLKVIARSQLQGDIARTDEEVGV
ncbi:hypothetical protein TrVE_jg13125 [Triparma verrucosa]|uniref:Uncharacterized protein n=1 Tax=Triparma verrucosa TaxID=1606542 RepID=A0A9W7CD22_9STRA|nr:hypothetical protein TrVE_jg13125 [Triparma verrucosa]